MEDLIFAQNQLMGAIKQVCINFKKDGADRKTAPYLKKRLETLDAYWQEFQANHSRLQECDPSHEYFVEHCYERTLQFYNETRASIMEYTVESRKEDKPLLKPATPLTMPRLLDNPTISKSPLLDVQSGRTPPVQVQAQSLEFPPVSNNTRPSQVTDIGNSKLDEMLRNQKSNFKAFSRTISNVDYASMTENWELEDLLKSISLRWSAIDDLHWKIDSELQGDNVEYEQAFSAYERKYNAIKRDINIKIRSSRHNEQTAPRTDIPSFSGDYHQWSTFKDLYTEVVHNNGCMSNSQKMQVLKGKLKGEAEKIVSHLRITSDNYQLCWDILNNRFNNTKLIFGSYMSLIMNLPILQQQSSVHLKNMHDSIIEGLNSIKNLGVDISTWDPMVIYILEHKLDPETSKEYYQYLKNPRDLPTVKDFTDFLENKFTSLESSRRKQIGSFKTPQQETGYQQKQHIPYKPNFSKQRQGNYVVMRDTQTKCPLCEKEHGLFHCDTFLNMQPSERRDIVTKLNLCTNCLFAHFSKKCLSRNRCRECQGSHHTLIHEACVEQSMSVEQQKTVTHASQRDITETLLATAMVNVRSADGSVIKMRALIDQGSQTSLITENAAQMLKLPRHRSKGVIVGLGAQENNCKGVLKLVCSSTYSDYQLDTDVFIMKTLVNDLPTQSFSNPSWEFLDNIQLADPEFYIKRPIDLLLGADVYPAIILNGILSSDSSLPVAQQTRLGWILCGNVKSYQCNVILNNVEEIQRFWEIEDIPSDSAMSQEDTHCLDYFRKTTERRSDGRYVVRIPLIPKAEEQLGESKSKAIAQFKQLERRFAKSADVKMGYKAFIREYINLNHMQHAPRSTKPSVYLPHHCVLKADSTTTALRVVFNASSKTSSGKSLNDVMYRGPNLQQDLLTLIIKWRQYKYAYTADIEKMFRNISLHDDDKRWQTIIWRECPTESMKEYQLSTVSYGTKSAPFLAMMVLKQLAQDEGYKYKLSPAATVLKEQFYMDDLIHGNHNLQDAKQLQTDLIHLLRTGGFNLRKWSANSPELLQNVSAANAGDQVYDFKDDVSTKTLGLRWHPQTDEFTYDLKMNCTDALKLTKRTLLSEISKLFDPLGWLTPVTTKLKLLFQQIWFHDLKWDDELPTMITNEWIKVRNDLGSISEIRVPRWLKICENDVIELHGFADASKNAYACVIYCKIVRCQKNIENESATLVAAKSRLVPPKKEVTLPRLELSAALLLSALMQKVRAWFAGYSIKTFSWSDSTAVLGWLQGDPGRWQTFVANRVVRITAILPPETWRYVKSSENPADCASRGIIMNQLTHHPLWWHGPAWLLTFKEENERHCYSTEEELRKPKHSNVATTSRTPEEDVILSLLSKNSSWSRVTRILAYVLRVKENSKRLSFLTAAELIQSRLKIIKRIQEIEFEQDVNHLHDHKRVNPKSKLLCLNPFIDQDGLLRVGGRLKNACISQNMMHPLIIPQTSHLTNLLIDLAIG